MHDKFTVEIISPDKSILNSEAIEVTIPSYEGQMGILKDHIPIITFLRPGIILIQNQEQKKYFVEEGTVEFSNDKLLILSSSIINKKDFSTVQVSNMLKDTKKEINNNNLSDKIKYILSYKIEALESIN